MRALVEKAKLESVYDIQAVASRGVALAASSSAVYSPRSTKGSSSANITAMSTAHLKRRLQHRAQPAHHASNGTTIYNNPKNLFAPPDGTNNSVSAAELAETG